MLCCPFFSFSRCGDQRGKCVSCFLLISVVSLLSIHPIPLISPCVMIFLIIFLLFISGLYLCWYLYNILKSPSAVRGGSAVCKSFPRIWGCTFLFKIESSVHVCVCRCRRKLTSLCLWLELWRTMSTVTCFPSESSEKDALKNWKSAQTLLYRFHFSWHIIG